MSAESPSARRKALGRGFVGPVAAVCLAIILVAAGLGLSEHDLGFGLGNSLKVLDRNFTEAAILQGVTVGDRLLSINGIPLETALQMRRLVNSLPIGSVAEITLQRGEQRLVVALPIRFKSPRPVLVTDLVVALAFLSIGTAVGWQRPQHRAARLFFLAAAMTGLYYGVAHVWQPALVFFQPIALGFATGLALQFFLAFPRERWLARSTWRFGLYLPGLILCGMMAYALYQVLKTGVGIFDAPRYYYWLNISFGYLVLVAAFGLASVVHLYVTSKDPVVRRQIQWIVWGLSAAVVGGLIDMLLTKLRLQMLLGNWTALLSLTAIPLPGAFALAILRHGLMDVTLVIKRSMVYALLTAGLVAVYLLLVSGLSTALGLAAGGPRQALVLFISALVIGLLVTPLRGRLQAVIDGAFFQRQVNYQRALARWSEELSTSLLFADLAHLLLDQVPGEMAVGQAWLLVLNQDETRLEPLMDPADPLGLAVMARSPFARRLETTTRTVILHGHRDDGDPGVEAPVAWRQAGVHIALPLVSGGQMLGIYLLGAKRSGDLYQRQELELLRTLANQAAVAMSNARLYEQVRAFSQELEKKVEDRTRELRDSLSVVYHELRTPITAIRGYVDMVAAGQAGPLTDRQARFLSVVRNNVKRLAELVADLSEVSQIASGRLEVHPEPMDLGAATEEALVALAGVIEEKALKVELRNEVTAPMVYGDYKRVVQIMTNLIGNACRYTPAAGQITVALQPANGSVQALVQDTGIGIRAEELDRIFERFYRCDDPLVREQRGTGLGLAITKSLVELQGGEVWVKSEYGKGSVFGFTLPEARVEPSRRVQAVRVASG